MDMTVHTLKYIHKRRGCCKAVKAPVPEKPVPEPVVQRKPKITEDIVNDYIKQILRQLVTILEMREQ